jgi:aminoglycoside phosphotransferase (APT) family kinase protein
VPVAVQRDDEQARTSLAAWLARVTGGTDVEVGALSRPDAAGYSNETLLLDASWTLGGRRRLRSLVVRVEPTGHTVFPHSTFERQARVLRALHADGTVPVPEVLFVEDDPSVLGAPFLVMEQVPGRVPPDTPSYHTEGWFSAQPPALQAAMWWAGVEAMAAVHHLAPNQAGVDDLVPREPADLVEEVRAYVGFATGGAGFALLEDTLDELARSAPPAGPPAVCWGDSRLGNLIMAEDGTVAAVLDWEMVDVGDPTADLAWYLLIDRHHHEAYEVPRLPALPSPEATVARWEELTGRSAEHLDWYRLLGAVRYAAIVTRVMHLLEDTGILPGGKALAFDHPGSQLLRRLLDAR